MSGVRFSSIGALVSLRPLSLVAKNLNRLTPLAIRSNVKAKFPSSDIMVSRTVPLLYRWTRELGSVVPLTMKGLWLVKAGRVI